MTSGDVLAIAEGEGRNAVFLAEQGHLSSRGSALIDWWIRLSTRAEKIDGKIPTK